MTYLLPDTENQVARFTLDEGRSLTASPFTHYLLLLYSEDGASEIVLSQVVDIIFESARYTEVNLSTSGLGNGRYRYVFFGQNSQTNTDPNDSSVVGVVESGVITIQSESQEYVAATTYTIEGDVNR